MLVKILTVYIFYYIFLSVFLVKLYYYSFSIVLPDGSRSNDRNEEGASPRVSEQYRPNPSRG